MTKKIINLYFLIISLCLFATNINDAKAYIGKWQENEHKNAKIRIIATIDKIKNQNINNMNDVKSYHLLIGLQFDIKDHWKIYSNDAREIGLPPQINFTKNNNYLNHNIIWPNAEKIVEKIGKEEFRYSIYKKEITIPIELELKSIENYQNFVIELEYSLCEKICVFTKQDFILNLEDIVSDGNDKKAENIIYKSLPKKYFNQNDEYQDLEYNDSYIIELVTIITLAIIGGLILNIMPCVLPVISIKILSLLKHRNSSYKDIRKAFLAIILGILFSFLILALIAISIKLSGDYLGWGLQFQNIYFVGFLIIVIAIFIANLLDWWNIDIANNINNIINNKIDNANKKQGRFLANFLSGILAVLLATPCSAPFLGTAISLAVTKDNLVIFLTSIAIAIGFAMPYLLLIISPKLLHLLPKPGSWMIKVKKLMILFLLLTNVWLSWIISSTIGNIAFFIALFINIAILSLMKNCQKIGKKTFFAILSLIITIGFLILEESKNIHQNSNQNKLSISTNNKHLKWQEFIPENIDNLINDNKIVIIDITADWCLTCKLNKIRVFSNDNVVKMLQNPQFVLMQADITKPNEKVMQFLRKHNRYAIPFNVIYGIDAKNGILTSEILTIDELNNVINKVYIKK